LAAFIIKQRVSATIVVTILNIAFNAQVPQAVRIVELTLFLIRFIIGVCANLEIESLEGAQ